MLDNIEPIKTLRASEAIYEKIVELILRGHLNRGDKLPPENVLIEKFRRSRPTVREALRMLEQAGYIKITSGEKGAIIQGTGSHSVKNFLDSMIEYNKITLENVFEYRSITEYAVAEWAAIRRTDKDIELLKKRLHIATESTGDKTEFIENDFLFHYLLAEASKNELAVIMFTVMREIISNNILNLLNSLDQEKLAEVYSQILDMHREILDAIIIGDPVLAREKMQFHIESFSLNLSTRNE